MPMGASVGSPEGSAIASSIFAMIFSVPPMNGNRPRGSRSLKKTFGIAVMTWKCLL